ncbi:dihydrofolate reductase [Cantharellus anzutake]|uniref:dihydrofolate reductase n=1 Tax=Cantharellus anzutake TaxID=1750568 RepID=UPI0019043416|nr:dihydrofolate reductase [Cantharellus anzutake]KAF8328122.1 dihydrofolate reductase [Cantharellus anzutake]
MALNVTIIVAATRSNRIGVSSQGLPWRLPLEMAYFAHVTSGAPKGSINAVVMGRKTWESIPSKFRPLKNRLNLVITNQPSYDLLRPNAGSVILAHSLDEALKKIDPNASNPQPLQQSLNRIFIIGGATIYNQALSSSSLTRILLTRITEPDFDDCDVFLPEFRNQTEANGERIWTQSTHQDLVDWVGSDVPKGSQQEKDVEYEFQMWTR